MKGYNLLLALTLLISAQNRAQTNQPADKVRKDAGYVIKGRIDGIESGMAYMYNPFLKATYSALIEKGNFVFTGRADTPQFFMLRITQTGHKVFNLPFFAENKEMHISGNIDDAENVIVTGSETHDEYKRFYQTFKSYDEGETRLGELKDSLETAGNTRASDSLRKIMDSFGKSEKRFIKDYVWQHPASQIAGQHVFYYFKDDPNVEELDSIYKKLDPAVQKSYYGRKIDTALQAARRTVMGNIAPDFAQQDVNGNLVKLSSFRGKYLLIEFWASWCAPCRVDNPNIVTAYAKYHSKGFDILGVSLDEKKDKWEGAIKMDNLGWSQVSDLQGWNNSVRALYGVEYIPMNFLLDKDGKIIARALLGNELEMKLRELIR